MTRTPGRTIVALVVLLLFGGGVRAEESGIHLDQAWARATPGAATTGAVYLTLYNTGTAPDALTAVSTPTAEKAELHLTKVANGVMEMRPLPALSIAPGQRITLDPASGYHIMLIGLKAPLKEGDHIPLTLTFQHAGAQQVVAMVAKIGAMHAGEMSTMPGMSMPQGQGGAMPSMPAMQH